MQFFKEFSGTVENKHTHAFGGDIQYRSPQWHGLSFGLGDYASWNLGLNSSNEDKTEVYLPSDNVNVLGKAFLRYQGYGLDVQGGRIGLDTPFANEGNGRTMIPLLYQGYGGSYALPFARQVNLYGYRIYRFKPGSSDTFGKGDVGAPEVDETSLPSVDSDGFSTVGLRYGQRYGATAEAWYYHFDKRAQLAYTGAEIPISGLAVSGWTPFVGAQYLHEWDASDQAWPYQNIDTDLYSARIGIRNRNHSFSIITTQVPSKDNAFLNGAYFAPYSFGIYNTTPIEDGQPLASMVTSNQPGNSLALRYVYHNDQWLTVLGYTRLNLKSSSGVYYPLAAENVNAGFMILGYNLTQRLNIQFEFDYVNSPSTVTGNYHAERLRLVYKFGSLMPDSEY
ncbi:hypothetical protein ABC733_02805 [Mangrovibacter sp. SLW1]